MFQALSMKLIGYFSGKIRFHKKYGFFNIYEHKVPQSNLIAVVQFNSERMFAFGFFSNSKANATKKLDIFFNIVSCTESL